MSIVTLTISLMQKPNALENATIVRTLLILTCINLFVFCVAFVPPIISILFATIVGVGPLGMHNTLSRYSNYREYQPTTAGGR